MELVRGQLVTSRAGRDVTRAYVVLEVAGDACSGRQRALVANGVKWTLAAPKPKNPRHLQPVNQILAAGQMETDEQIQAALAAHCSAKGTQQRGG